MDKVYIAIDLKSFYASVECADRNLNPLTTNLVVADESRTEKTICLAVTPSLKAHGISGRARLFEVIQAVKDVNNMRFNTALRLGVLPKDENGRYHFASQSFNAAALVADPSLELSYIIAPPRMKLYEEISTRIFSIYMRYISAEDIHVYSIDECFMDVTGYLGTYRMTPHELAMTMIREVLYMHVTPDIISVSPDPLPHEKSKVEQVQEGLAMMAYHETAKRVDKQVFDTEDDEEDSDAPQIQISPEQLNIALGRRNEGDSYPVQYIDRKAWNPFIEAGYEEWLKTRVLYKKTI